MHTTEHHLPVLVNEGEQGGSTVLRNKDCLFFVALEPQGRVGHLSATTEWFLPVVSACLCYFATDSIERWLWIKMKKGRLRTKTGLRHWNPLILNHHFRLRLLNVAMENDPFVDDVSFQHDHFPFLWWITKSNLGIDTLNGLVCRKISTRNHGFSHADHAVVPVIFLETHPGSSRNGIPLIPVVSHHFPY